MAYFLHILILINIYIIIAISLNLIAGYTGILSIAHAAFYGVGAYVAALLAVNFGTPFLLNLIAAMAVAGAVAAVVAFSSLRIHDDYLVIATFGFLMILFSIFNKGLLALAPQNFRAMFEMIQQIKQTLGTTFLIVEQKVRQVLAIADRVYVLKLGQVSDSGSAKELLEGERLRKAFL